MTTIHQRNWKTEKFSNDDDSLSKSSKIHLLEFCQTNVSLTGNTIQLILSLPISLILFLPSTKVSLFEKFFHQW